MSRSYRLALTGDPVHHSRSPAIHRAALSLAGLDGDYVAIRADTAGLEDLVGDLRTGSLDGLNVTMPLKSEAAKLADRLTDEAAASGSVNTMRARGGMVEGHSTDVVALREVLRSTVGSTISAVLVLGSGGAAAASLAAIEGMPVYVSARDRRKAAELAERFDAGVVSWEAGVAGALLVNATPLGMRGEELPHRPLESAMVLVDLPYGKEPTPAVEYFRRSRRPVVDGVGFLVAQAVASFEWWTGVAVDSEPLVEVAKNV